MSWAMQSLSCFFSFFPISNPHHEWTPYMMHSIYPFQPPKHVLTLRNTTSLASEITLNSSSPMPSNINTSGLAETEMPWGCQIRTLHVPGCPTFFKVRVILNVPARFGVIDGWLKLWRSGDLFGQEGGAVAIFFSSDGVEPSDRGSSGSLLVSGRRRGLGSWLGLDEHALHRRQTDWPSWMMKILWVVACYLVHMLQN